ncbi:UbiA-like polyprenyltransferase [Lewinella cohaerens]|uniref:UbiA-like polyprenyltransferase n=1 Tax=Lewinella cohaerens TaxID=70995 RepID=UPI00037C790B|nr:UbiA-like polyprenyltransferase [Lewinella cohaerens]
MSVIGFGQQFKSYLSLVKFSHTIFALPFALVGFTLGTLETGVFNSQLLLLVILCMVFARSAAMAFNRYLDRDIDVQNPRTKVREIPAGVISARSALYFVIGNSLLFWLTTWFINPLCFALAPVALLVVLGYSYTKRFTSWCHFVLGLGLALAPVGAFLAVTGYFSVVSVLYGAVVLLWVSGFDIIYALQDRDFDEGLGLQSIPVALGRVGALRLSNGLHMVCGLLLLCAVYLQGGSYHAFDWLHWLAAAIFLLLLGYQHTLVKPDDLSKINIAFFTTNGLASLVFGGLLILDVWV